MLKNKFFCTLFLFFVLLSSSFYGESLKIGIVDIDKITRESQELQKISDQISEKQNDFSELAKKNDEFYKQKEEIEGSREFMDGDVYIAKNDDIDGKIRENQQYMHKMDLINRIAHNMFIEDFNKFLKEAADSVREDLNIHIINVSSTYLSYDSSLDITSEFQTVLNKILQKNNIDFVKYYDQANVAQ